MFGWSVVAAAVIVTLAGGLPGASAVSPSAPPLGAPPVLAPVTVTGSTAPAPTPDGVAAVVTPVLESGPWSSASAVVLDPATGAVLDDVRGTAPTPPASTLKVLTALTALTALGPDTRLRTRVVRDGTNLVLIGAGDSTLSSKRAVIDGAPAASLDTLAAATAKALTAASVTSVTLGVDDSLFTGPRLSPGWSSGLVAAGEVSPVTALMVDQGRESPGSTSRVDDHALSAGRYFAQRLRAQGIDVTGSVARAVAPSGGVDVAQVSSPTVAEMVEYTLTESDNDVAEALAHLAGGKLAGSASFEGGATATRSVLASYSVPTAGLSVSDGSGLSKGDRIEAITLARTIEAIVAGRAPTADNGASPVGWAVSTGMPVAGFTGTLADRFDTPSTKSGLGVVRAKTGTLTGVVSLAGFVRDREGRLLVFALLARGVPDIDQARTSVDRFASVLAGCGCGS